MKPHELEVRVREWTLNSLLDVRRKGEESFKASAAGKLLVFLSLEDLNKAVLTSSKPHTETWVYQLDVKPDVV